MRTFKFNSLSEWFEGSRVHFKGKRVVHFKVMHPETGIVYATDGFDNWPIACGDGQLDITFACPGEIDVYSDVVGARFRVYDNAGTVERTSDVKFTSIERRRIRNHEFEHMMAQMKFNEERRERMVQDEIRKLREKGAPLLSEVRQSLKQAKAEKSRLEGDDGESVVERSGDQSDAVSPQKGGSSDDNKGGSSKATKSASSGAKP